MKTFKIVNFLVLVCLYQNVVAAEKLSLKGAYLIDGIEELQPSGLASCNGKLLFVSDKHESDIFQLEISENNIAKASSYLSLKNIPNPPEHDYPFGMDVTRFFGELFGLAGGMDWEGIACNSKGEIFIASEYHFSVLKVSSDGKSEWVVDDLYEVGAEAGLFETDNAYIEGLMVDDKGITLAAEREPRGVIYSPFEGEMSVFVQSGGYLSDESLPYDYAGLEVVDGTMIALERNHYQVCDRKPPSYSPGKCYSFKDTERSKKWGYNTGKYGLAEGLAIDGDTIWIIVDNNGDTRLADEDDSRSTLMRFNNPFVTQVPILTKN